MKITPRDTDNFVQNPNPAARAILIYGPDEGMVRERATKISRKIAEDLNDPFRCTSFTQADLLDDPACLPDEAFSISMLGGDKAIRIRDASDKITGLIKEYLENPARENLVVIEAGNLPPRSSLRKLMETSKNAAAIACYTEDARDLGRFIARTLKEQGYNPSADALTWLGAMLTGDRQMARRSLETLTLYKGDPEKNDNRIISIDDVRHALGDTASVSLDDLVYAVADGQVKALERNLQKLFAEGQSPVAVLRALQNHFRRLHLSKIRMEKGLRADEAMAKLRPPVFFKVKERFGRELMQWSADELLEMLNAFTEAEIACKSTNIPDTVFCSKVVFDAAFKRMPRRAA